MKTKRAIIAVSITALIVTVLLISIRAYYIAIVLVIGVLILGYREIWSLLSKKKLPPIDERIKENTGKSIRNGFLFYVIATACLMLPFAGILTEGATVPVLGGLFIGGGLVYLLSYLFYDRVEPKLDERELKRLRIWLLIAGMSLALGIISIFLHNAIYGLLIHWFGPDFWTSIGIPEEPVFFFIAVFISPLALVVGLTGSLVIYFKGLFRRDS
ncbi:MAG: hypothetical protein ABH934_03080 [Chloroflexota bacterium]